MRTPNGRLAAGLILALAIGTFGPVSRALSMESRTYLEIAGPLPGPTDPPVLFETYMNSQRGIAGRAEMYGWDYYGEVTFIAAVGTNARATLTPSAYAVRAGDDARAYLTVRQCSWNEECKSRTWTGGSKLDWDGMADNATFAGLLRDEAGRPCNVDVTLTARAGPNVTYDRDIHPTVHGRTSRPAWFSLDAPCVGGAWSEDGELWTDHIVGATTP